MFFFVLFIVFLVVITRHFSAEYKLKAIRTGEAELSPVDKSILPFCKICKIGSVVVFTFIIISGMILLIAETSNSNLLSITRKEWSEIHIAVVSMFSALFIFLTYVHWNWFKKAFTHKVGTVR